jgi:hypothetical protein
MAVSLRRSELSFRMLSRAVNMYSLESSGPMILLTSWRLDAIGNLTSCIIEYLHYSCRKEDD